MTSQEPAEQGGFIHRPTLYVPLAVWTRMMAYVQTCPVEINGLGYVRRHSADQFVLEHVFILEQTVGPAHASVQGSVLGRHITEMIQADIDTTLLRFQWHSHVEMQAYFSGVDTDNIERYNPDWMISLVTNKFGNYQVRLDMFDPLRASSPMNIRIMLPTDPAQLQEVSADITHKVNIPRPWRGTRPVTPIDQAVTLVVPPEALVEA